MEPLVLHRSTHPVAQVVDDDLDELRRARSRPSWLQRRRRRRGGRGQLGRAPRARPPRLRATPTEPPVREPPIAIPAT